MDSAPIETPGKGRIVEERRVDVRTGQQPGQLESATLRAAVLDEEVVGDGDVRIDRSFLCSDSERGALGKPRVSVGCQV